MDRAIPAAQKHSLLGGNTDTAWLKVVALVFMLIDHLGVAVFGNLTEMRILGRIALPIYAWCLVVGCEYTHNIFRYALRLLLLAAISQPMNMGSGILQAVGDTRRPLYFLIFSAVVNTVLDLVFVLQFHLGVAGVAYATIIAQFLSAALILIVLSQDNAPYGIRWGHLRVSPDLFREILRIGMPSALQQAITSFSNIFVQGYINSFGSACMSLQSVMTCSRLPISRL